MKTKEVIDFVLSEDFLEDVDFITSKNAKGQITSIQAKKVFNYLDEDLHLTGIAKTAKEDLDFATQLVGEKIAYTRLRINALEEITVKFPHIGEDMDNLVKTVKALKKELKEYIDLKESFFERVRNTRRDPNYYKVRHLSFDDEGRMTEI